MKSSLLTIIVALAALQGAPAAPQRGQAPNAAQPAPLDAEHCSCSLEVIVKREATGEPIRDAEVSVKLNIPNSAMSYRDRQTVDIPAYAGGTLTVRTDASGRAIFLDLAEGLYTASVHREGYFYVGIDGWVEKDLVSSVSVGPPKQIGPDRTDGQLNQQVVFTMVTGGSISGRILDANHKPLAGISVAAARIAYRNGQRTLNVVATTETTDELGAYRLPVLPAAEYYIRTESSSPQQSQTYYPGTLDPMSAKTVVLHEGENLGGIDFSVPARTSVTISGTIINAFPGGELLPNGLISRSISTLYLIPRNTFLIDGPPLTVECWAAVGGTGHSSHNIRGRTNSSLGCGQGWKIQCQ